MVHDVYNAAWQVLESLNQYGSNVANQILLHTKIGSKTTLYKALDLLIDEELIMINPKKVYSINFVNYTNQSQVFRIYEEYQQSADNFDSLFSKLTKQWKNHKQVLDPRSKSDKHLARELITKPPYYDIVSLIVRFFELGSFMDFYINSTIMTKTIEKRAFTIRRKNEKFVLRFMELLKKTEPVLWGETIMLIQTRLATKISPA